MSAIGQASCFARHVATPGPACSHTLGHTGPHSWEPAPSRDHRALEDSFDEARAQASQAPGLAFAREREDDMSADKWDRAKPVMTAYEREEATVVLFDLTRRGHLPAAPADL